VLLPAVEEALPRAGEFAPQLVVAIARPSRLLPLIQEAAVFGTCLPVRRVGDLSRLEDERFLPLRRSFDFLVELRTALSLLVVETLHRLLEATAQVTLLWTC